MLSVALTELNVKRVLITDGFSTDQSTRIHIERHGEALWGTSYSTCARSEQVVFKNVEPKRVEAREHELWPVKGLFTATPATLTVELRVTGMVRITLEDDANNTVELHLFAAFHGDAVEVLDARGRVKA